MMDIIGNVLDEILFYGILIVSMYFAQKFIDTLFDKYFGRLYARANKTGVNISKKRYDTLSQIFKSLFSVAIWFVAILVVLGYYDVNYAALLTGAGAIGIFFGIAGKDIIMDVYVGSMVLIEDQYRVGDVIKVDANHSGFVEEITLRTVKLRDIEGNLHIVPHSLARSVINMTYEFSNVSVLLGVAYNSDLDKVIAVINKTGDTLAKEDAWKKKFIEPIQYQMFMSFDESQMTVRALGRVKPGKQWEVTSEFRRRIKEAFDKNSIEIPFPQRVIHNITSPADPKKPVKK